MLTFDAWTAVLTGFVASEENNSARFLGKSFEHNFPRISCGVHSFPASAVHGEGFYSEYESAENAGALIATGESFAVWEEEAAFVHSQNGKRIDKIGMWLVGWNFVAAISNPARGFDEPQPMGPRRSPPRE